jgi:nicotinate-nucleotide adenylyltransferase
MLRVGIFGGSFNPPHVAHVLAASYTLLVAPIDHVCVIPVFQHPFAKELAPYDARLRMCELAFAGDARVEVSDVERQLGGESRTLRTLEHLQETRPDWSMRLIIGSDVVADLPKWHQFDRIAAIAPPFVLERRGKSDKPGKTDKSVLPEVSSTEIRELVRRGEMDELSMLLPRAVLELVRQNQLYGCAPSGS